MPTGYRWFRGGPGLSRAGRNALFAADDTQVWVWDEETGNPVTDLLDETATPISAPKVVDGWVLGAGLPDAVRVASFSLGKDGKRYALEPANAAVIAQDAADAAASSATSAASSATSAQDAANLVGAPAGAAIDAGAGSSTVVYVRTGGNDSASGKTWGSAKASLSAALTALGANPGRIVVEAGTYSMTSRFTNTVAVSIEAQPGTTLQAGFTDTSNGLFYPAAPLTISGATIDGNGATGAIFGIKIDVADVRLSNVTIKNTRHFGVYVTGSATRIVFDNVRIDSCGSAEFPTGGGFYNSSNGNVLWSNCVASNNYAQGWYNDGDGTQGRTALVNVVAFGNGAYGIDMRSPGSTLTGFACYDNAKGGVNVALRATATNSWNMAISNGAVYSNGPSSLSDAFEFSISNTDRLTVSNVVIESDSLKYGMKIQSSNYVALSNVQIRGTNSDYVSALQTGAFSGVRCKQITVTGCTLENPVNGNVIVAQDVDGFYLTGGKVSAQGASAIGVRYLGTVTDSVINPASWGHLLPGSWISNGATNLTRHRLLRPTSVGALPTDGLWLRGEEILNATAAVGSPKSWICTTTGGASSAQWAASTAYTVGTWVRGATTGVWECKVAGTSGATEPTGNIGDTVTDGTVTWVKRYSNFAAFTSTGNL
jgi:hypothetical protein